MGKRIPGIRQKIAVIRLYRTSIFRFAEIVTIAGGNRRSADIKFLGALSAVRMTLRRRR